MNSLYTTAYFVFFTYGRILAEVVLFVVIFILLLEMIIFFKKLNRVSLNDVRFIFRMARDEFGESDSKRKDD